MNKKISNVFQIVMWITFLMIVGFFIYSSLNSVPESSVVCEEQREDVFYDELSKGVEEGEDYYANLGFKDLYFHTSRLNKSHYNLWFEEKETNRSMEIQFKEDKEVGKITIKNITSGEDKIYIINNMTRIQ